MDRTDICEAHYLLEADYNVGGWLRERPSNVRRNMSSAYQLWRMKFTPSPILAFETLTEDGKRVYLLNVLKMGLPIDDEQIRRLAEVFEDEEDLIRQYIPDFCAVVHINRTFEEVGEGEDGEVGVIDSGFDAEDEEATFSELVDLFKGGTPSQSPITNAQFCWVTQEEGQDPVEGTYTSRSIHLSNSRPRSEAEVKLWKSALKSAFPEEYRDQS